MGPAQNPRQSRTVYYICVKTTAMPGTSCDARVYVELRGEGGSTGRHVLRNANPSTFRSGQVRAPSLAAPSPGRGRLGRGHGFGKNVWDLRSQGACSGRAQRGAVVSG